MVRPEELRQRLRQQPFQPFQVHLADGRVYEVRYPGTNMVTAIALFVGIPATKDTDPEPVPERVARIELGEVVRLAPLNPAQTAAP